MRSAAPPVLVHAECVTTRRSPGATLAACTVPWLAYGGVEIVFCSLIPWLAAHPPGFWPLSATLTAVAISVYAAIGAAVGGITLALARGLARKSEERADEIARAAARAALPLAFVANLWAGRIGRKAEVPLAILALTLAGAPALASAGSRAATRLSAAAGPWATSFALLGYVWATLDPAAAGVGVRGAAMASLVAGAALLAGEASARFGARRRSGLQARPRDSWLVTLAVVTVLFIVSLAARPVPLVQQAAEAMPTPDPAAPNILLVTLDTVRADHLRLYGYARGRTPNLDAFAAQATVYDHAYSPADMTLPSHASIFTGLYASWHGAHYITGSRMLARPLDSRFETLAERVRARGYATAAVVANHGYLAPAFGLGRGFDYYDARYPASRCGPLPGQWLRGVVETSWCVPDRSWRFEVPYRRAHAITDEAVGLMTRLKSADRPFFLFVNYMDAHRPYFPPPPYDGLFPGRDPAFTAADYYDQERRINSGEGKLGDRERENRLSQYDGGISYLDAELGRLLDDLAARGLLDRTLVVITSDHGEGFGEHDLVDHGVSVFQELIHVPLLVRSPGGSIARRVATPVSTLDIFSTILETAGAAPSATAQGIPLDQSGRDADRLIFSESFTNDILLAWSPRFRRIQRAAISGGEKLILATDGRQAFYDLSSDPGERENLTVQEPAMSAVLEAQLAAWLEGALDGSEVIPAVDPGLLERLRKLGYVR